LERLEKQKVLDVERTIMNVPGHHPIQELVARKLFNISTVPHSEALAMVSRCAKAVMEKYDEVERPYAALRRELVTLFGEVKEHHGMSWDACMLVRIGETLSTLEQQIKELQERDPWSEIDEQEFARVKEFKPTDDGFTQAILEGEFFKRMIILLGTILKNYPSYVEFRAANEEIGEVLITCQKVEEPTPSEKVSAYRKAFQKLHKMVDGWGKEDIPQHVAMEFIESVWKEVPNEEKYRADEDHDRGPVPVEGADAGESGELPGGDGPGGGA
jgi:hypothetical protein